MSLYDFLYKLQRQPYKTRRRILIGFLAVSFVILLMFWMYIFRKQVADTTAVSSRDKASGLLGENKNLLSPAAALIGGIKSFKNDIFEKIEEYKSNSSSSEAEQARPIYKLPEN